MKKRARVSVLAILLLAVLVVSSSLSALANGVTLRITTQPTNGYAIVGKIASTEVDAVGEGLKYKWFVKDVSSETFVTSAITSNRYSVKITEENSGRQVYCVVTDINGDTVRSDTAVLSTPPEIQITKQPENIEVPFGQSATISVDAMGEELKYNWYVKDVDSDEFVKSSIEGKEYFFKMSAKISGRQAYCVITDKYGASVMTDTVIFSGSSIKITKQPTNIMVPLGGKVATTVEADGEGLKYQWYVKDVESETFVKSSIKSDTYVYTMTTEKSGRQAYCVITDKYGNKVTSDTVVFSILEIKITKQPTKIYASSGKSSKATIEAEGEKLRYQWYVKDVDSEEFVKSSITGSTYICTMTAEKSGRKVYCIVTDSCGNSVTSEIIELLLSDLKITKQPQNTGVAYGESATVAVEAEGEGLTYEWFVKDLGENKFILSETTTPEYTINMTEEISGREVYCVVTDSLGNSLCSEIAIIGVSSGIKITKQPTDVHGELGTNVKTSIEAEGEGLKYTWYVKDKDAVQFVRSAIKRNVYEYKLIESKIERQVYCVVTDKYNNSVTSEIVTFRKATLKITQQLYNTSGTIGSAVKIMIGAEGEGLTYKWYVKDPGNEEFKVSAIKVSTYSFSLSAKNAGRQLYCVVTDKYGDSVKSNTIIVDEKAGLKIVEEPQDLKGPTGINLVTTINAEGIDLKYEWYKKDVGEMDFVKSSFTTNTYTLRIDSKNTGRQIYCVITDGSGNTVKTRTLTLSLAPTLEIVEQPTNIGGDMGVKVSTTIKAVGVGLKYQWYEKDKGESKFELSSITTDTYDEIVSEQTSGREIYCIVTDAFGFTAKSGVITLDMYKYFITTDLGNGKSGKIGVNPEGDYGLINPVRTGYDFVRWVDADGNEFTGEDKVFENTRIIAVWDIYDTDTLEELLDLTAKGADAIKITGDITIDTPIYISYNTRIYSDGDYTIKRAPEYPGDIFVVGRGYDGITAIMKHRRAVLTVGGGEGTLTIDGNKDNVTTTVNGSVVFVGDSGTFNLYDGAVIKNNKKISNERVFIYTEYSSISALERAGGAAVVNIDSTVNIYGGIIENNEVLLEYTIVVNEDGTETKKEYSGCGGAIFNRGTMTMLGGTIRSNSSLRGGAVYNDRKAYIRAGIIEKNTTISYGGAISSSGGQTADLYIGSTIEGSSLLIKGNHSGRAGGAIYSGTNSPIIIYGNTVFEGNVTESSGAAIYTAGVLEIENTIFRGNNTFYSGGAIYKHHGHLDYSVRPLIIKNCVFEENSASLGGAIILSAIDTAAAEKIGTRADIENTVFKNNQAVKNKVNAGNGGAIYSTRYAQLNLTDCIFEGNTATSSGGGISIHSGSNVAVLNTDFNCNQASSGGAIYISNDVTAKLDNIIFDGNGGYNGGALYTFITVPTMKNLTFKNNTASSNGAALYMSASDFEIGSDCTFEGNTALGHGGAVYMTYQRLADNTRDGSTLTANNVLFKNNTALAGGAVSVRTSCKVVLNGAQLINNTATGEKNDASGGGAIYVGYGEAILNNVTATGNSSAGYGGVICAVSSPVNIDGGIYEDNYAPSGGVINATVNTDVTVTGTTLKNNKSTYDNVDYNSNMGGGAVNIKGGNLTLVGVVLDGNTTDYYGGALLTNDTEVNINNNTIIKNSSGGTGAALYLKGNTNATLQNITITNNAASSNGVIYTNSGSLLLNNITATSNKANKGGVVYVSGIATVNIKTSELSSNSATSGGIIYSVCDELLTIEECIMNDNSASTGGVAYLDESANVIFNDNTLSRNQAKQGGAIYSKTSTINLDGNSFTENTVTGNGGAVYIMGATVNAGGDNLFENNSATGHAGAIYVSYFTDEEDVRHGGILNVEDGTFRGNTALAGGAVSVRTGCEGIFNGTLFDTNSVEGYVDDNDGDGEGGGVVYVGFGTVTLNDVIATNNTAGLGGVVDSYRATVNITGGTYSGNSASSGGVIYAPESSTVNISGPEMNNNESTDTTVDGKIGGGAININGGTLTVSNTVFDGNKTKYYGGAINAQDTTVTITENSVIKNTEGKTGAALYFRGSKVTIENSSIENNTSTSNGVIYTNSGTLTFNNITATGNKSYNGGVLYASGGTTNINDSTITSNTATNGGGVMFITSAAKINATNSTFSGNKAANGGVVYAIGSAKATLNSCTLSANSGKGGSVYVTENADVTINGGTIENHSSTNAIWTNSGTTNLIGVTAKNNQSSNGTVVYAEGTATVNATGSVFTGNTGNNGAVIYAKQATINLDGNTFTENTVTGNGGAVYIMGATVNAGGDNLFENNSATGHAGAIYVSYFTDEEDVRHGGILNVEDGTFRGNTALAGGAVSVRTGCEAIFNGTLFDTNSVEGYVDDNDGDGEGGGVVYVGFGTVTLNDVTATNNTAGLGGVVDSYKATVNITGGTYSGNSASSGGVIYAPESSTVNISGAEMNNNESTDTTVNGKIGGGAVNINGGTLTVSNTVFDGNKTKYYGGAINAQDTTVTITENSVIKNTEGKTGAALYFRGSKVTIENSSIENNTSTSNGVIYTNSGTLTFNNITATGNKSYNGGVLYASGGTNTITGSTFTGNTASNNGGVLYTSTKVTMTECVFENNAATSKGGAIYGTGNANIIISENSEFKENTAPTGGAIYLDQGAKTTVTGGTFDANTATGGEGGAIVVADTSSDATFATNLTLNGVIFKNNTASSKGGAISTDATSPNLVINATDCTFDSNKALGAGGGAVEIQNGNCNSAEEPTEVKIVFTNCAFTKNTAKTTGAAIEIRSNSCAKVDTITATENKATGVGGVIYVTSNFSRFYLTGAVTISANTASDNSFINLYNSNYTCPPKIYTTHSSSAEWYSLVKGNKTNIAFDLVELP